MEKQTLKIAICHHTLTRLEKVKCMVCKQDFDFITPSHLKKHGLTMSDYRRLYPDIILSSKTYSSRLSQSLLGHEGYGKGLTYEEMYGKQKACELRSLRGEIRKGKTLEEIFGKEKAERIRKSMKAPKSLEQRKKNSDYMKRAYREGRLRPLMYDPVIRDKVSRARKGKPNYWCRGEKNPAKRKEVREKLSKNNAMKKPEVYSRWLSIVQGVEYRENMSKTISMKPTYPKLYYVEEIGHYVRSSWEEVIARQLRRVKVDYEYEVRIPYRLNDVTKHFVADFLVKEKIIVEPHGPIFIEDFAKWKLTRKQGYKLILVVSNSEISQIPHDCYDLIFSYEEVSKWKGNEWKEILSVLP